MVDTIEKRVIDMITLRRGCYIFIKQKYDTLTAESNIHFDLQPDPVDVPDFTIDMFI